MLFEIFESKYAQKNVTSIHMAAEPSESYGDKKISKEVTTAA
jgi:hypothetical protein